MYGTPQEDFEKKRAIVVNRCSICWFFFGGTINSLSLSLNRFRLKLTLPVVSSGCQSRPWKIGRKRTGFNCWGRVVSYFTSNKSSLVGTSHTSVKWSAIIFPVFLTYGWHWLWYGLETQFVAPSLPIQKEVKNSHSSINVLHPGSSCTARLQETAGCFPEAQAPWARMPVASLLYWAPRFEHRQLAVGLQPPWPVLQQFGG